MSNATSHPTEAQRTQVPPEIRRFAIQHCRSVDKIDRFSESNETLRRGWVIKASGANLNRIPEGYEPGRVGSMVGGGIRLQITEEF